MFLAHLPAGYLLTKRIEARSGASGLMPLGLIASVLPDLDLFRFYILDHRRVMHYCTVAAAVPWSSQASF